MSDYRRCFVKGGTYFFTIVTSGRTPILTSNMGRKFLRQATEKIRKDRPFELIATALLPDRWHLVMRLPSNDDSYSIRIKRIKEEFTVRWLGAGQPEAIVTCAQENQGERGVWQPRFWEHTIQNVEDLERCVDYIHWNPRKHDLVRRVRDWKWSSFHRFVESGHYDINWGGTARIDMKDRAEWGEP